MEATVIITGGRGFVGTHLYHELTSAWPDTNVVVWDLPEVDVTRPETYQRELTRLNPDWIVHLAAIASVPQAIKNAGLTRAVNVEGTKKLYEAIQSAGLDTKVLFVSTADIYGEKAADYATSPIPELQLGEGMPNNPYAESKLEAEQYIENNYNDRTIRVRPFPHIGPGQREGFVTADFASQIAAIEAGQQEPVIQVGNLEAKRDFTDVRDVVRAYRLLIEQGTLGEVYHVASGKPTSVQTILDMLRAKSTASITVTQDSARMRPSDIPVLVGSSAKLFKQTSWQPTISLEQSLSDILGYWRNARTS